MTEQDQRIAIAEAAGFTNVHRAEHGTWCGIAPGSLSELTWPLPDYLNDLNAMHEAEETLTGAQCLEYEQHLNAVTKRIRHITAFGMIHATAAQRAEAFLKVKGKWKD